MERAGSASGVLTTQHLFYGVSDPVEGEAGGSQQGKEGEYILDHVFSFFR
jgi:hypothetical protein